MPLRASNRNGCSQCNLRTPRFTIINSVQQESCRTLFVTFLSNRARRLAQYHYSRLLPSIKMPFLYLQSSKRPPSFIISIFPRTYWTLVLARTPTVPEFKQTSQLPWNGCRFFLYYHIADVTRSTSFPSPKSQAKCSSRPVWPSECCNVEFLRIDSDTLGQLAAFRVASYN